MPDLKTQRSTGESNRVAAPAAKEPTRSPRLLMGLGIAAAASICMLGLSACDLIHEPPPPSFQDLGPKAFDAAGLKGSLKARWAGNSAQYQLEIEPSHPLEGAGFSSVVANPPSPFSLHMNLLDMAGSTVCGKDVLFPFNPSSPGEADRERGQDLFVTSVDDSHKIASMNAQGTLPCTDEQYKKVASWEFTTNFPTLAEQDRLMRRSPDFKKRQEAQQQHDADLAQKLLELQQQQEAQQKAAASAQDETPRAAFYLEGVERVIKYDASNKVLETKLGGSFQVTGPEQAMARMWAENHVLFHYKCDEHSDCVLASAGGGQSMSATAVQ